MRVTRFSLCFSCLFWCVLCVFFFFLVRVCVCVYVYALGESQLKNEGANSKYPV